MKSSRCSKVPTAGKRTPIPNNLLRPLFLGHAASNFWLHGPYFFRPRKRLGGGRIRGSCTNELLIQCEHTSKIRLLVGFPCECLYSAKRLEMSSSENLKGENLTCLSSVALRDRRHCECLYLRTNLVCKMSIRIFLIIVAYLCK